MDGAGVDALVVTHLTNVRYLTGFTGSAGLLVVRPAEAVLVTDGRYTLQSASEIELSGAQVGIEIAAHAQQPELLRRLLAPTGETRRWGLEAQHVSWAAMERTRTLLPGGSTLVPTSGLIEGLRAIKDDGEISRMARAAAIADEALARVAGLLEDGPTEAVFALTLDNEMRALGADNPAFATIVAAGPDGAQPHHQPGRRRIDPGQVVVVDFGAEVEGYRSDMTRTIWAGELSDPTLRRVVEVVLASQTAGLAAVKAGVPAADVDRACREVIASVGWGERFVHGTGHGVGLDIHEAPAVGQSSADTLAEGQVLTVEPGVYLPDLGGSRVEDTVVVTRDGCRPLTLAPKQLLNATAPNGMER
jgi:Xaa-Pro aminopeptidase